MQKCDVGKMQRFSSNFHKPNAEFTGFPHECFYFNMISGSMHKGNVLKIEPVAVVAAC